MRMILFIITITCIFKLENSPKLTPFLSSLESSTLAPFYFLLLITRAVRYILYQLYYTVLYLFMYISCTKTTRWSCETTWTATTTWVRSPLSWVLVAWEQLLTITLNVELKEYTLNRVEKFSSKFKEKKITH